MGLQRVYPGMPSELISELSSLLADLPQEIADEWRRIFFPNSLPNLPWEMTVSYPLADVDAALGSLLERGCHIEAVHQSVGFCKYGILDRRALAQDKMIGFGVGLFAKGSKTEIIIYSISDTVSKERFHIFFLSWLAGLFSRLNPKLSGIDEGHKNQPTPSVKPKESLRRAHSPEERRAIANRFHADMKVGKVSSREAWAKTNYTISARTLRKYLNEYPDPD